jgi:hypothetical protein
MYSLEHCIMEIAPVTVGHIPADAEIVLAPLPAQELSAPYTFKSDQKTKKS